MCTSGSLQRRRDTSCCQLTYFEIYRPDTPDDDADEWLPRGPIKQNTSSGTKNTNVRR